MAKNKISEWSSTAASNTDIGGIDIAEGCAPSGINNAIREVMAQVKDMVTGADGDSQTIGGNLSVTGTSTLTGAVTAPAGITANLTGTVTGNITGNAATVTNGVYTTGNQTIAGTKTFSSTISGSIDGNAATVTNGVYTTGDQTIGGVKTFSSNIVGNLTGNVTGNVTGTAANVTGTVAVANGGTGQTTAANAFTALKQNATDSATGVVELLTTAEYTTGTDTTRALTSAVARAANIVRGTVQASTSGTSIDFTGIPSWAKRITVLLREVSTNGSSDVLVQVGTASGYISTGYLSSCGRQTGSSSFATLSKTTGFNLPTNANTDVKTVVMTINNISGNNFVAGWTGKRAATESIFGCGSIDLSETLNSIRITTDNGTDTFDAGSINIMYE